MRTIYVSTLWVDGDVMAQVAYTTLAQAKAAVADVLAAMELDVELAEATSHGGIVWFLNHDDFDNMVEVQISPVPLHEIS